MITVTETTLISGLMESTVRVRERSSTVTDNVFKARGGLFPAFQFVLLLSEKSSLILAN